MKGDRALFNVGFVEEGTRGTMRVTPSFRNIFYVVLIVLLVFTVFATTRISMIRDRGERRRFWWDSTISRAGVRRAVAAWLASDSADSEAEKKKEEDKAERARWACRNSRQGREWLVDDRGFLCRRGQTSPDEPGCCLPPSTTNATRYSCEGCIPATGCCSAYERCVSCCLSPDSTEPLRASLKAAGAPSFVRTDGEMRWQVCTALCRTSSNSVLRQRFYKSATHKYCFKPSM